MLSMNRPRVTVITATHGRPELLFERCIPSVAVQTYPAECIEHIVVADGPDPAWDGLAHVRYVELGRNWRTFSGGQSYGAIPRLAGTLLARGTYLAYLDDDDAYRPEHIACLVDLLESSGADFVFSRMARPDGTVIGNGRPEMNHIGTPILLHRAELLNVANWRPSGYADDWDLVQRWLAAGATWAALSAVTVDIWPGGMA